MFCYYFFILCASNAVFMGKNWFFDLLPPIDLHALNAGPPGTKQRNDFNFVPMGSIKQLIRFSAGIIVTLSNITISAFSTVVSDFFVPLALNYLRYILNR